MGASWTRFLQVPQDRRADACHKRVLLGATLLWPCDMNDLAVPVQILQTEPHHLATAQSVDSQQQDYRAVTQINRAVSVKTGDESLNVLPVRPKRQALL